MNSITHRRTRKFLVARPLNANNNLPSPPQVDASFGLGLGKLVGLYCHPKQTVVATINESNQKPAS
jgi:hypothetical protein